VSSNSAQLEAFLARLYVDATARASFKSNPRTEAKKAGLSDEQCAALENLDWIGLEMAGRSFAKKRHRKRRSAWFAALRTRILRLCFSRFIP
jgi:Aromatic-ring-opening dioxygenase LigAB, LigA subunit